MIDRIIAFRNPQGLTLVGRFLASAEPGAVTVFAHGLRSDRNSPRNLPIARALVERGISALLFDFSGHGDSEGTIAEDMVAQQSADLAAAIRALDRLPVDRERVAVVGSSTGASAAVACPSRDRWQGLVLRGPSLRPLRDRAAEIAAPTLVVVGGRDPLKAETREFYERLRCEKAWREIDAADHLFARPAAHSAMRRAVVDWLDERLLEG